MVLLAKTVLRAVRETKNRIHVYKERPQTALMDIVVS
jgi:hypothetical protein